MTTPSNITLIEETGSTNADCSKALRSGVAPLEGHWLVSRRQTSGKGRQGRKWFDGSGNFMGSTIVSLQGDDPLPSSLTFVAALAVFDAVSDVLGETVELGLKWPNDVLLGGGKLSGILLELVDTVVVVGVGVNLAVAPNLPDRKTAAVADFVQTPELESFAELLARQFDQHLQRWRSDGLAHTLREFSRRLTHSIGSPVTVHDTDGSMVQGTFAGLEESDGALRLRLADGSERVIRAGDIT